MFRVLELRAADGPGGGPEKTILHGAALHRMSSVAVCYLRQAHDRNTEIAERARKLGIDYLEIRQCGKFDFSLSQQLRNVIRHRNIQIVHAHEYKSNYFARLLAKSTGVIPLSTAHGWTGNAYRERFLYYPADRRWLRSFPLVLAVSTEIAQTLLRAGLAPAQVRVLLNGINVAAFSNSAEARHAARRKWGVDPQDVVLGAVGRIERQKRFDLLLEVVARLRTEIPAVRALIAGEGSLRRGLEDQVRRLGLGDRVQFVGHVHPVQDFYAGLDFYVQTSEYEGTPNVVLEAMAMGIPVVATNAGGTGDLLRHGREGWLVPEFQAAAVAEAVQEALRHPALARQRAQSARARVDSEFSFPRRCETLEAIYAELVERWAMRRSA